MQRDAIAGRASDHDQTDLEVTPPMFITKTTTRLFALLAALVFIAAACGGGDDDGGGVSLSGDDAELAEALAAAWQAEGSFPEALDAQCLANGFVSGVGGAEFAESQYGVTPANVGNAAFGDNPLRQGEALAAAGAMFECENAKREFVRDIAGADMDDTQLDCLNDAIAEEPLVGLIASVFMGDDAGELEELYENDFEEDLFGGMDSCGISF